MSFRKSPVQLPHRTVWRRAALCRGALAGAAIEQHLKRSVTPPAAQQAQQGEFTRHSLRGATVEEPSPRGGPYALLVHRRSSQPRRASLPDSPAVFLLAALLPWVAIAISCRAVLVQAMRACALRCPPEPHCLKSNSGLPVLATGSEPQPNDRIAPSRRRVDWAAPETIHLSGIRWSARTRPPERHRNRWPPVASHLDPECERGCA